MSSRMGKNITAEVFGESHSKAIGITLEGIRAGQKIDAAALAAFMKRRAPGQNATSTPRKESDEIRFLCGILDGVSTGAPITAVIENSDAHSSDYDKLRYTPRPSHADYAALIKYDGKNDISGGGHFSGRLTAPLCIGGGIALQILEKSGIRIAAHALKIAGISDTSPDMANPDMDALCAVGKKAFPTLSDDAGQKMQNAILSAKADGDSVGGVIECFITGMRAGTGEPMFDGIENRLAAALFGIPAVKGVEFGSGFAAADMRGSVHNDPFVFEDGEVRTKTNNSGGIQGGISNGMPIVFRIAVKPTPSIAKPQETVNLETKQNVTLEIGGRHDPCIVARAVPVAEAVAALCVLDMISEEN